MTPSDDTGVGGEGNLGARLAAAATGVMRLRDLARLGAPATLLLLAGCGVGIAPFGRSTAPVAPESLTLQRITGQEGREGQAAFQPLLPEAGNVWPGDEAPRATLANPDSPSPGVDLTRSAPVERAARERGTRPEPRVQADSARGGAPPEAAPNPRNPPPERLLGPRGSSSPPPDALESRPTPAARALPDAPLSPPPARQDGRVIPRPGGAPAVTTGGTGAYQTYTVPGTGQSGIAIPGASTTTLVGPDGSVQVVPNPR